MSFEQRKKAAAHISDNWGKFFTEAAKGGTLDNFKSLFHESEVSVVLQTAEGEEVEFVMGTNPETCVMNWEEFADNAFKALENEKYERTESSTLGLLGNRMILETGRLNKEGECYLAAASIVEFNEEGKIIAYEAFSDVNAEALIEAAQSS